MTLVETLGKPRRRRRKPPVHDDTARIGWLMEAAVAAAFAVPVDELPAPPRRTAGVAFARQSAMYLAHVGLGLTPFYVGSAGFGLMCASPDGPCDDVGGPDASLPKTNSDTRPCLPTGREAARRSGHRPAAGYARRRLR